MWVWNLRERAEILVVTGTCLTLNTAQLQSKTILSQTYEYKLLYDCNVHFSIIFNPERSKLTKKKKMTFNLHTMLRVRLLSVEQKRKEWVREGREQGLIKYRCLHYVI